jgi:hypothetical protein
VDTVGWIKVGLVGTALGIAVLLILLMYFRYEGVAERIEEDTADMLSRHERIWGPDNERG